jgi:hypothetical protein
MRWMVIYEYEVPGGALNLSSSKLARPSIIVAWKLLTPLKSGNKNK